MTVLVKLLLDRCLQIGLQLHGIVRGLVNRPPSEPGRALPARLALLANLTVLRTRIALSGRSNIQDSLAAMVTLAPRFTLHSAAMTTANRDAITSFSNPLVKRMRSLERKKARAETGLFLAEGVRLISQGLSNGWIADTIMVSNRRIAASSHQETSRRRRIIWC